MLERERARVSVNGDKKLGGLTNNLDSNKFVFIDQVSFASNTF